jgi:hypothetical protein
MLKICNFTDISNTMIPTTLGGSASPRLCVRELIAMIFDSVAMIFESVIKMFDSIVMIFDSVIMTFEPSIKIFDSIVMTFEFTAMTFKTVVKKFDLGVVKKFDLRVVKKFDSFIVKKFDLCIIKKFDHNDIIQRAKYFSIKCQFLFYFRYTRYSGAIGGDNISQSTTLFAYYFRVWALLSLESIIQASSALALFECGHSSPSNRSFRPASPWHYSSAGILVPRIAQSGQQRLGIIRVRAFLSLESLIQARSTLVLFECGRSCTSNHLLWASSASALFECGLRSLELSSSGQQRLCVI